MKRFFFWFALVFLIFTIQSCSSGDVGGNDQITTDISVSSSQTNIYWTSESDLMQSLDNTLSYNYGAALQSEVETERVFNINMTEVKVTITFKATVADNYRDSNPSNNSVTIILIRNIPQAVELKANGEGNTYELITSVFASGANPIEVPDCNHSVFGRHIDEIFDTDLNTDVFRFFIHTTPDNDRCINFDRQRNEIKTYNQSPDNLLGVEGETVVYNWKFKLPVGFKTSQNFTHLHQLKSVGGDFDAVPMYTLTARKGNPDRIELRHAETNNQVTIAQTPIAPLLDTWLNVTETIKYGASGTYALEIKSVSSGAILFSYTDDNIVNWQTGASFVRPKWGIYRSLINQQDLRDEEVRFADFSILEIN